LDTETVRTLLKLELKFAVSANMRFDLMNSWLIKFLMKWVTLFLDIAVWVDLLQGLELRHSDIPRPTSTTISPSSNPADWPVVDLAVARGKTPSVE